MQILASGLPVTEVDGGMMTKHCHVPLHCNVQEAKSILRGVMRLKNEHKMFVMVDPFCGDSVYNQGICLLEEANFTGKYSAEYPTILGKGVIVSAKNDGYSIIRAVALTESGRKKSEGDKEFNQSKGQEEKKEKLLFAKVYFASKLAGNKISLEEGEVQLMKKWSEE